MSVRIVARLAQRIASTRTSDATASLFKDSQDACEALHGLLGARMVLDAKLDQQAVAYVNAAFVRICRRDVAAVADVLQKCRLDVASPRDGRAASLLAYSLPKVDACDEVLWEQVVKLCEAGLVAGHWTPHDMRSMVQQVSYWGAYNSSLPHAVEKYVAQRIPHAHEKDVGTLAKMIAAFPELKQSPMLSEIASRAVQLMGGLSASALAALAQVLFRVQYFKDEALVRAMQEQGIRFAEDCDFTGAIQMLCFVASHRGSLLDLDVCRCLIERITSEGEDGVMDVATICNVSKVIKDFPKDRRAEIAVDLDALIHFMSRDISDVLTTSVAEGGLSDEANIDAVQTFLTRYIGMIESGPEDLRRTEPSKEVSSALRAIATFIETKAEEFISSESPPYSLIPHLLHSSLPYIRASGYVLMREAALQNMTYPTLQTFRFLLALGDHRHMDKKIFRHLRNQFCQTVKGIPMIQLAAALKCFVRGLDVELQPVAALVAPLEDEPKTAGSASAELEESDDGDGDDDREMSSSPQPPPPPPVPDRLLSSVPAVKARTAANLDDITTQVQREMELEDLATFLVQCQETIQKGFSEGMDVRCAMSLAASMFQLGHIEGGFYDQVASYLETKAAQATPAIHSIRDATLVRAALGEHRLKEAQCPKLKIFLDAVITSGVSDGRLIPSHWMNEYDPANHITPLTEEQQNGWNILERMKHTRSADTENLTKLAIEYMSMLKTHRPDDLKFFFGVFEEKVFKNDRLLKDCMDHLCELGIITKFSGGTIASILHSLAAIRFSFHQAVKRMLLAVSEEQWANLDAAVLANIVSGMAKLQLRIPGILLLISERLVVVLKFLTPVDTALLINSFQSLGFHDECVLNLLMQHASQSASRFDELSLTLLFGSTSIHRLMITAETSLPLLEKAATVKLNPTTKQKIVNSLKRSSLPRDLIASSAARVAPELAAGNKPLQLEAE